MRELRAFALEVFFSKWEFTARHHLCASDMQSMTLIGVAGAGGCCGPGGLGFALPGLHGDLGIAWVA